MKDLKFPVAIFSMALIFVVIGVMLWEKNSVSRIENLKQTTDYIVEANFRYQKEQRESEFIRLSSTLESKLLIMETSSLKPELQELMTLALSLAPYNTGLSLDLKMALVDCLEKLNTPQINNKQCTLEYAKQKVVKG